ncbi:MAG: septum formation initiator family protein [Tessaracoccus sp.]
MIVLLVVLIGLALLLVNGLRVYLAQAQELSQVRAEIAAQHEQIADLEDQLTRWDDPEYVRSIARSKLGWVMPGEVGYRVIGADGQPLDGSESAGDVPDGPELLWWEALVASIQVADEPVDDSVPTLDPDRIVGPSPDPEE